MYSVRITMSQMENQYSVTPEFQNPNKADRNQNTQMEISQSIPKNNTESLNPKPLTPMLQNKSTPHPKPLFCNLLMVLPLKNTPEQLQT